ncbi:ABC transporter ATP-binding protein [Streptomyces sp. AN091965]|uniref:ABC transporter ATP-binding protein n=1 Tax=Streptomyces sp. AN091965 TaxID=2927803 RepID=UPI001F6169CE|nr:ABC transporter ATP-binding protein [Streptomyces sp. AN091965]MCI3932694.1 ABC transporter ATP-binding protein [Streptomyces sp. AN091965]
MPLLHVKSVSYSYDGIVNALSDVSFTVGEGVIVGLVGPNGSGKSTLIKNVFDLVRLQSGSIRIGGHEHARPRAKGLAMYLSSNDYIPEFLTAREYITMLGRLFDLDADHDEAVELFRKFSMGGRYDDLIEDFSHGMRKKTQLVSALVIRPRLTVIDETLNGIDLEALQFTEKELKKLREESRSVLLCSHDFAVLERLADRILFLDGGHVVYDEPTRDLVDEYGSLATMVFDYLETSER